MKRSELNSDKRREAKERQQLRDKRTPEQQIAELDKRDCTAKKERAKLEKQIK